MAYIRRKKFADKLEWLEYNNFSKDGIAYCITGDNTYNIKDWLKEQGCTYSPLLKWHIAEPIDLPEGYFIKEVKFDDIYTWEDNDAWEKESAKGFLKKLFALEKEPSNSEWIEGNIGDRVRNMTARVMKIRGFNGAWGYTSVYTFKSGENILTWFTQSDPEIEENDLIDITFTIKNFTEYLGEKQTQISRPKIVKIDVE